MSKLERVGEYPDWLQKAINNPPPPPDLEELRLADRKLRAGDSSSIRDRLPRFLSHASIQELGARVRDPKMRAVVREWSLDSGNLLLLGEHDTGKTTTAGLVCRRLIEHAVKVGGEPWATVQTLRWFRADNLAKAAREWPLGKGECPELREATRASVLVLDELGWEQEPRVIASILADRFDRGGSWTIVTSGQTLNGLRERYGDAVVKRMLRFGTRTPTIVQAFLQSEPAPVVSLADRLGGRA